MVDVLGSFVGRIKNAITQADTRVYTVPVAGTIGGYDTVLNPPESAAALGQITTKKNLIVGFINPNREILTLTNNGAESIRYGYEDRATLNVDGHILKAGDSIDLGSPDAIYVTGLAAATVEVNIDEGEG